MLFAVSADEGLFKDALAFEEQVFRIRDRLHQNGKRACVARTPNIREDLISDDGGLCRLYAEMLTSRLDRACGRLLAFAGGEYAELAVEKLHAGGVIVGGDGNAETCIF